EIVPMPDDRRNDRRGLDHVGVRAGEVPHDLAEQADLFFDEGVGSVFGEPLARLGVAQSLFGLNRELGKHPLDRHLLEVDRGLRPTLGRSRSGLQGNGGHGLLLGTRLRESKKQFPKITRRALWIEIKDRPIAPDIELKFLPRARRGNDDHEFGLSFGSLMTRLRASDIGSWMLMARGGIGFSDHCVLSGSDSPQRISLASVSSTNALNCRSSFRIISA